MDKITDRFLTGLFRVANYVISMCSPEKGEPAATQETVPTIRFSDKDYVEGELFSE
jgi:hypothetical protein